jgi:hypothetical protein
MRLAAICVCLFAYCATPALAERAKVPPAGSTLVVVGQDPETADDYVRESGGRVPAGFMHYVFLEDTPERFSAHLAAIKAHADKYPGSVVQLGVTMGHSTFWSTITGNPQPPGALSITLGSHDRQLDLFARWLRTLDHPAHLRLGYEFDLLGGQWGTPDQYKAAYRYIVDRMRARRVRNALCVWQSAGAYFKVLDRSGLVGLLGTMYYSDGDQADPLLEAMDTALGSSIPGHDGDLQPISEYYPGRSYVDMFGISFWDDAYGFGRSSERARALYRKRTGELLEQAQALGLPLTIGESTPAYIGFDSGQDSLTWLRRYFDLIERYDVRVLSLIVPDWPNIDNGRWGEPFWNGYWPDARVHHFPAARSYWFERLAAPRYLEAGETAQRSRR